MKLTIEAENIEELMTYLMSEMPVMYADLHCNNKSGGNKIKWKID